MSTRSRGRSQSPGARKEGRSRSRSNSPVKPEGFRDGDWMCKCGEHNYKSKSRCRKCHRDPGGSDQVDVPDNFREGDWLCSCGGHNYSGKQICFKCQTHRCFAGVDASGMQVENFRKGDWICQCGGHNYAGKTACFKCGQMVPSFDGAGGSFGGAAGFGGTVPTPASFRAGDWMCVCGGHNYTGKNACYKCRVPREQGDAAARAYAASNQYAAADGANPYAAGVNAYQQQPYQQQPYQQQPYGMQGYGGYGAGGGKGGGGGGGSNTQPANWKNGDWMCKCGGHNYTGKTACFKCKQDRSECETQVVPNTFRSGDWMCSKCNGHNYSGKTKCYKCSADRTDV